MNVIERISELSSQDRLSPKDLREAWELLGAAPSPAEIVGIAQRRFYAEVAQGIHSHEYDPSCDDCFVENDIDDAMQMWTRAAFRIAEYEVY